MQGRQLKAILKAFGEPWPQRFLVDPPVFVSIVCLSSCAGHIKYITFSQHILNDNLETL